MVKTRNDFYDWVNSDECAETKLKYLVLDKFMEALFAWKQSDDILTARIKALEAEIKRLKDAIWTHQGAPL